MQEKMVLLAKYSYKFHIRYKFYKKIKNQKKKRRIFLLRRLHMYDMKSNTGNDGIACEALI